MPEKRAKTSKKKAAVKPKVSSASKRAAGTKAKKAPEKAIEFPKGFIWGTSVCSHQAEGHNTHSDWWTWEKLGKIDDGSVSGPAADMLNRYPEDFKLMEKLGYNAFRLSVEWARIEPRQGEYSEEALLHYENVLKEMRKRKLKVCLTLYHWVLPQWVSALGGWTNPKSVEWFGGFSRKVVERLYDYVDIWVTLNEPTAPAFAGYLAGVFPPEKKDLFLTARVFRNLLKAHVVSHDAIRDAASARGLERPPVGIAMAIAYFEPKDPSNPFDKKLHEFFRFAHNEAFLDAIHNGRVPVPFGVNDEIPGLKGSHTFVGVNYYTRFRIDLTNVLKGLPKNLEDMLYLPEGSELTEMGYEVYPPGFYNVLSEMSKYGVPMYITENGVSDGTDVQRPGHILRHLKQVHRAIGDGMDIRGYFHWSYVDNFEWKHGYSKRFGLVALEPGTLNRLPRKSAYLYGEIAKSGKISGSMVKKYAPEYESEIFD